nr:10273_t:CDS:2 [Entrophospora candida]
MSSLKKRNISNTVIDESLTKAELKAQTGKTWGRDKGLLYAFLPAKIGYGQQTPAGHILPYKVNGLLAWVVTHLIFIFGAFYFELWKASIIHDKWGELFVAANIYGFFLTFFVYIKAYVSPSHPEDRKFSGSFIYDLLMGIEMNPRFGKYWDFKLFHNGRPGIIAWTLINLSFAAAQYNKIGYVTNSMILLNFLHLVYVLDFFYNEDWYLRTIVRNTVDLPWVNFFVILSIGLAGYYIFRAVNHQKDVVRKTNGNCKIWGKPAKVIKTQYLTSDGKIHSSLLLVSGYWGKY